MSGNDNDNENKKFINFDDFLQNAGKPNSAANPKRPSVKEEKPPLHLTPLDRDRNDDYGKGLYSEYDGAVIDDSFWGLFPQKSICLTKIKEMFSHAEDKYEKFIAVCMLLTVLSAYNPISFMLLAFGNSSIIHVFSALAIVVVFVVFFTAFDKKFSLIGIGIVSALKVFPFIECVGDVFFASAMFILTYLLYCIKKRKNP